MRAVLRRLLTSTDGVAQVIEPERFAELGLPDDGELDAHRPDFAIEMKLGYFVHFEHEGDEVMRGVGKYKAMHGYTPQHEECWCDMGLRTFLVGMVARHFHDTKQARCFFVHTSKYIDFFLLPQGSRPLFQVRKLSKLHLQVQYTVQLCSTNLRTKRHDLP
jgi:hypothetical protein